MVSAAALVLIATGVLLVWSAVVNRSPIDEVLAAVGRGPDG